MADSIEGDITGQLINKEGTLGTRAHQAHITFQYVEQLRQLVDAHLADEAPDTGDAVIIGACPTRLAITLCIATHATELGDLEQAPPEADTLLAIEHRGTIFNHDQQGRQHHYRRSQNQEPDGSHDIEDALHQRTAP